MLVAHERFHEKKVKEKEKKGNTAKVRSLAITLDKLSQLHREAASPYPASYLQKPGPLSGGM